VSDDGGKREKGKEERWERKREERGGERERENTMP